MIISQYLCHTNMVLYNTQNFTGVFMHHMKIRDVRLHLDELFALWGNHWPPLGIHSGIPDSIQA
jgi:hypothetical protein